MQALRPRRHRAASLWVTLATVAVVLVGCGQGVLPAVLLAPGAAASGDGSLRGSLAEGPGQTPALAAPLAILGRNLTYPVEVIRNVDFARPPECAATSCSVQLDVFVPAGTGPFRSVVLVRGGPTGPGGRGYMEPFAQQLAASGLLVFNADMRDIASSGGGYPEAFEDVACAIRYARTWSAEYEGGGGPVTLVGHSLGGYVGSVVALDPTEFEGGCLAAGSGRPDAFVGLSGNYDLNAPSVAGDLAKFFGGSVAETLGDRVEGDPFNYATGTHIPVRLVAGTADTTVPPSAATALDSFLVSRGWDVDLTLVPGGTHQSILDAPAQGATSVSVVLEATAAAAF